MGILELSLAFFIRFAFPDQRHAFEGVVFNFFMGFCRRRAMKRFLNQYFPEICFSCIKYFYTNYFFSIIYFFFLIKKKSEVCTLTGFRPKNHESEKI